MGLLHSLQQILAGKAWLNIVVIIMELKGEEVLNVVITATNPKGGAVNK